MVYTMAFASLDKFCHARPGAEESERSAGAHKTDFDLFIAARHLHKELRLVGNSSNTHASHLRPHACGRTPAAAGGSRALAASIVSR